MRIGILSNCQNEALAIALRALLPAADVIHFDVNRFTGDAPGCVATAGHLRSCDHVISADVAPGYGPLGSRALAAAVPRFHLLPTFYFGGFHPDTVAIRLDHVPAEGPTGGLQSRIVTAAFLAGLAADETVPLFNSLVFARLGYFGAIAEHGALLLEKYAAYGIDLSAPLARWLADGCFMHSVNHPKMRVMLDLARVACAIMGLPPEAEPDAASLHDPMRPFSTHPFLPDIAARAGMAPEGVFRDTLPAAAMPLDTFVARSFQALRRVPLSTLRATQGVMDALAKLELKPAPRAARKPMAGDTCLLTTHGTILRVEAASGMLVHEALWPEHAESSDLALTLTEARDMITSPALGGAAVAPGPTPGTVCVRRGDHVLSAYAERLAVRFRAEPVTAARAFIAVPTDAVAHLRAILAGNWAVEGTARRISAARIRLRPGFILEAGGIGTDLRRQLPDPVPESAGGAAGYALHTAKGRIILRPAPEPRPAREIALRPAATRLPDEAGSLAEFRTKPNSAWTLDGPEDVLHPPVTANDRDAAWVFDTYAGSGDLPCGVQTGQARLLRMPGKFVLTARGVENVVLDRNGLLSDAAPWPAQLPPGLRLEEGVPLLDAAMLRTAPVIPGTVALFAGPASGSYAGWLIEAALRLHVMAPNLPPGTQLLIPSGIATMRENGDSDFDHFAVLKAVGLGTLPRIAVDAPVCRANDAVWLDAPDVTALPGALLRRFRKDAAALYPRAAKPHRIFVQRRGTRAIAANPAMDDFLAKHDILTVVLEDLPPEQQIALFLKAELVIGAHGAGLANIIFCPPGARVLELAPRSAFRPRYRTIAEKCGLIYGVMPCQTEDGGFDGTLRVDPARLRALFRVLRFTSAE
jgi:hypothetical protein